MKKVFIHREAAYGDHIHMSPVIRAYAEDGWEVTVAYNFKGAQIHTYNPFISNHVYFERSAKDATPDKLAEYSKLLNTAYETYDRFVTLQQTLEEELIPGEHSPEFFWPLSLRRAKNSDICFYDHSMIRAGLTGFKYMGRTGDIFFTKDEHNFILDYLEQFKDKYIIIWAIRGSMYQKAMYPITKTICDEFIKRHPETVIITTGDKFCQQWEWDHPNVIHKSGRIPFRQALNMAKYVDMVVTPETGLGIGAGSMSVPKIMLLTAASITNIVGNDVNDYSMQSPAYCSPCFRAIYNTDNCPTANLDKLFGKVIDHVVTDDYLKQELTELPICVYFPQDSVLDRMEEIYNSGYSRNWDRPSEEVST